MQCWFFIKSRKAKGYTPKGMRHEQKTSKAAVHLKKKEPPKGQKNATGIARDRNTQKPFAHH